MSSTFITTLPGCPFCRSAKNALESKGVSFKEYSLNEFPEPPNDSLVPTTALIPETDLPPPPEMTFSAVNVTNTVGEPQNVVVFSNKPELSQADILANLAPDVDAENFNSGASDDVLPKLKDAFELDEASMDPATHLSPVPNMELNTSLVLAKMVSPTSFGTYRFGSLEPANPSFATFAKHSFVQSEDSVDDDGNTVTKMITQEHLLRS